MSAIRIGDRSIVAADWLSLAAAPAFALMALLTAFPGGRPESLCTAAHDVAPLGGMTMMYALMAIFHLPRWLKR